MKKKRLPAWATPAPPEEVKKPRRDQVLPPVRVTPAELAKIRELAAEHYAGNVSELVRARALGL
tara:strand:- start:1279 stop:1470 length:192 start_codon:yes stop_codon:yes gene_type:complete